MDLGITGRRAAVAAGSAGLGLGAARALVAEGVHVAICGRDAGRLRVAVDDLRLSAAHGAEVVPIEADVSDPDQAAAFVARAGESLEGVVDILVANAGGPPPGTFTTTSLGEYRAALELNMLSAIAMCQAAAPGMQAQAWGRVVAITSIGVHQPIANLAASVAARTGLTGFLKVMAADVAPDGVTVNSVLPGVHATERIAQLHGDIDAVAATIPVGVVGDPDDFGAVIAFLCSRQARFITGAAVGVDGGAYLGLL